MLHLKKRISSFGVIGPGNLGEALLRKISRHALSLFYHPRKDRCIYLESNELGLSKSLDELLDVDIIFITVKPGLARDICGKIKVLLKGRTPLFISVMAGVPTCFLQEQLGISRVVRIMLDMSVGELHLSRQVFAYASTDLQTEIKSKCSFIGRYVWLDQEEMLDTSTAIFGCGPAFVARFYQAYLKVAKDSGFDHEKVEEYVMDLFDGTISMINNGTSPESIINKVACKGGATERGLQHLKSLDASLVACIGVAEKRCQEMREELEIGKSR